MTERVESDISMKRYLLGELAEPEQQELEQRLITSNEFFEELLVAEDELVDEYLHGKLSPREQEKFNSHFLCTPERREKLRFSRSLQRYVSANAEGRKRPGPGHIVFLSAGFLRNQGMVDGDRVGNGGVGGIVVNCQKPASPARARASESQQAIPAVGQQELQQQLAQLRERNDQLASELAQQQKQSAALEQELAALKTPTSHQPSSSMVAFALMPGGVRDIGNA